MICVLNIKVNCIFKNIQSQHKCNHTRLNEAQTETKCFYYFAENKNWFNYNYKKEIL